MSADETARKLSENKFTSNTVHLPYRHTLNACCLPIADLQQMASFWLLRDEIVELLNRVQLNLDGNWFESDWADLHTLLDKITALEEKQ